MPFRPALPLSLVLLVLAMTATPPAQAQVRRCSLPDGQTVFTDRRCDEVGGVDRLPRQEASTSGLRRSYRGGCARNLQDLFYEVTSAIDGRDANRLASVYHWAGMSSADAYRTLSRLDAIAQRPGRINGLGRGQLLEVPIRQRARRVGWHHGLGLSDGLRCR